jgi:hypothetical protein
MTDRITFGEQGRHYADFSEDRTKPSEATKHLLEQANSFLRKHMPDAEQRIKRTIEQWNQIIRNAIIAETGLRLSVGDDQQNVPVRLHPGMPKSFADIAAQLEPGLWELLFNQHLLNTTKSGLQLLLNNGEVLQSRYTNLDFRNRDIERVQYMLQRVIALLEERNFAAQFRAIDQDVLGAYFFHYPEVRIYWVVISLMARFLNVSVEGLTIAVLTHELAHAYTHLGRDVDGSRWETAAFAQTELYIVEGLAQFYTDQICRKLMVRATEPHEAFKALRELQPAPYQDYQQWSDIGDHHVGEVVRFAMVACRTRQILTYRDFRHDLEQARKQVGRTLGAQMLLI